MKILMLSKACCIRVVKEGTTLEAAGHDVIYLHERVGNPELRPILQKESTYLDEGSLRTKLKRFDPDVVHVHAEPADLVTSVWETLPNVPIVFDIHDCLFMRYGSVYDSEVKAFQQADALIHPSKGYRTGIGRAFPKEVGTKRSEVIRPCMPKHLRIKELPPLSRIEGLVYEGGSVATEKVNVSYRDFSDVIRRTHEENIPFFIFSANAKGLDYTADHLGLTFPRLPYIQMMAQVSRFSYGLLAPGFFPDPHMEVCMPNKLFEYLASGIPVVTWGCAEVAEFVQENECGVVLSHPDDLTRRCWEELLDARDNFLPQVEATSAKYTMESQIPLIESIYEDAIKHKADRT